MNRSGETQDAVVIGGGIVGCACAWALSKSGFAVTVVEPRVVGGGATGAGMGHLCVLDDSEAQFALSRYSQTLWDAIAGELPKAVERSRCGTLWAAADEAEMGAVFRKESFYRSKGIEAHALDAAQMKEAEPNLVSPGGGLVAGGLLLPEDSIIYAPPACRWMLDRAAESGGRLLEGRRVASIAPQASGGARVVTLDNGRTLWASVVVVATGAWAPELFPGIPIMPRKGHLAITERMPGFLRHQVVELAYIKNSHPSEGGVDDFTVSFNVQPRPNGQVLIGSSRQYSGTGEIEPRMLKRLLDTALGWLPGLAAVPVLRAWTGLRAATTDWLPIIGEHPHQAMRGVYFATGHEGLGLTTSLGTAALIAASATGQTPPIDPTPYLPSRFAPKHEVGAVLTQEHAV
jgi:glycine/D-amino acid oxidase-like deaminating enzyme